MTNCMTGRLVLLGSAGRKLLVKVPTKFRVILHASASTILSYLTVIGDVDMVSRRNSRGFSDVVFCPLLRIGNADALPCLGQRY